jgi:hypothetical protein
MARTHRIARRWRAWIVGALVVGPTTVLAQAPARPPIVGRWDLQVTGPDGPYPSWLEVWVSGHRTLVGRFVGGVGSARPIGHVEFANGTMRFAIPPQWEQDSADLRVEGTLDGDRLSGTLVTPGGQRHSWTATRAPALHRAAAPTWGTPVALFNGKDLSGWTTRGGENKWRVIDGVLTSAGGGANLLTTNTFDDFKLHVEFRYPKGSNSGVYLRGRYEVQIEDDESPTGGGPALAELGPLNIGGVYGFLPPNENASKGPGEWQTYDITLVGRRVTVVLNGRAVITDAAIPGITGGALDSNEGAPGPIYLQGDHGRVEFRKIELTPTR